MLLRPLLFFCSSREVRLCYALFLLFSTALLAPWSPVFAAEDNALANRPFKLDQPYLIGTTPFLTLDKGVLVLDPVRAPDHQAIPPAGPLPKGWPELAKEQRLKHLLLQDAVLTLDISADKQLPPPALVIEALLKDSWFSKLTMKNCQLRIKGTVGAPLAMQIKEAVFEFDLEDGEIEGGGTIEAFHNEALFQMEAVYAPYAKRPGGLSQLEFKLAHPLFAWAFEGQVGGQKGLYLKGETNFQLFDWAALRHFVSRDDETGEVKEKPERESNRAGLKKQPVLISGYGLLTWSEKTGRLEQGQFQFGPNKANGTLSLKLSEHNHTVSGSLAFEKLALNGLITAGATGETPADTTPVVTPGFKFEGVIKQVIQFIRTIDADLRISAQELLLGPLQLEETGFSLYQKGGEVIFDVAEITLFDGQARGHIKIDTTSPKPRWHINTQFSTIDLARLKQAFQFSPFLKGTAVLKLHLTSFGDKVHEIFQNMFGALVFQVPKGGDAAVDLNLLLVEEGRGTPSFEGFTAGHTPFERLEGLGHIAKGRLVTDFLSIKSEGHDYTGKGIFNLLNGQVDWYLAAWQRGLDDKQKNSTQNPDDNNGAVTSAILLSCTHIAGDRKHPRLESTRALHLSLMNKVCPVPYHLQILKKHDDTIVQD